MRKQQFLPKLYLLLLYVFFSTGINNLAYSQKVYGTQSNYIYTESLEDFPNPERGFYRYSETRSGNYVTLKPEELKAFRRENTVKGADYSVYSTLVFRYFVMSDFVETDLSEAFLDSIAIDFRAAREGGVKLIPRFVYTTSANRGDCGAWICTPYGDATKEVVLRHIEQLKPLLQEYSDVIAVLQKGFIGIWGEQYYTDHFGDASTYNGQGKLVNKNWRDRNEVLQALLNSLPETRMVQVRYPQQKQRYLYGHNAPTDSPALNESKAWNGSDAARIGLYNDCFLSSYSDVGTYSDYGNDLTESKIDTTNLKPYLAGDSKFTAVGGETCRDDWSPFNKCEGNAVHEMERMHFSFLNAHYNNKAVNNHWVSGGCIDEIKRRLGYRFVLREAIVDNQIEAGGVFRILLKMENVGFASPFNPRLVEVIMRDIKNGDVYSFKLKADPRFWFVGNFQVSEKIHIPSDLPKGKYKILLNLPDPEPTLKNNPDFSIRLANECLWEAESGLNSLQHVCEIN
ncbi:DUF4832 domain-containing protein [Mariniphaga sp.]|uniref:DUF4832 domain-containing protein n=1 Tax=Mariniphaga sp. TaxID=1954475 RepID=UPI00356491C4